MTEISFNGGRFVSNREELNYEEVLNHFPCASIIRILTYNISRNQQDDKLLNALKETNADVQIITNVPSRMASFDSEAEVGEIMQSDYSQCAFDDQLDYYTQKAMDRVQAVYEDLHDTFFDQGDDFLNEMQAILRALEKAMSFSKKWKASKINPEIDNT